MKQGRLDDDITTSMAATFKKCSELCISVPNPRKAIILIEETGVLHIAALTGMMKFGNCQEAVDSGYKTTRDHFASLLNTALEMQDECAIQYGLQPRPEALGEKSVNQKTSEAILAELDKE